jgi:hypothetical protein
MNPEVKLLDKYIKKEYPFVLEVLGYSMRGRNEEILTINLEVSPSHFCELFFNSHVESKTKKHMSSKLSLLISGLITEWHGNGELSFNFSPPWPKENESVLNYLS